MKFAEAAATVASLADDVDEAADVCVTLLVHAGVAAADVICCARLGEHARGESHTEAVSLLGTADAGSARHLETLLGMKTRIGHGHVAGSRQDHRKAQHAAEALLKTARAV